MYLVVVAVLPARKRKCGSIIRQKDTKIVIAFVLGSDVREGTWKEYREFETKQKYRCAICKKLYKPGELFFDHCHRTKKKRGLLCRQCNFGVAFFKDSIKLLRRAILYLANSRRKHR